MKIGVLSDIHGNLPALEAALDQMAAQGVDSYVCLGDVAVFGPQPSACVAKLRGLNCQFVMGNTDAYALDPYPLEERNADSKYFNLVESWTAEQLSISDKKFIAAFAPTQEVALSSALSLLAYHGSPASFNDPIRPTTPLATLDGFFGEQDHAFLAGGHVHLQFMRPYRGTFLFNPGSVGLPIKQQPAGNQFKNPAYAEYAILSVDSDQPTLAFHRAPYSLEKLIVSARVSGMPAVEWWLKDWVE